MNTVKKFAAEFVGTAIMIFTGIAVAISVNTMLSANSVGVPMGFSVTVTALAFGLAGLLCCLPVYWVMDRYAPWMLGRWTAKGKAGDKA